VHLLQIYSLGCSTSSIYTADAWVVASVTSVVCLCVSVWVCTVKEKRLELSTLNLVHMYIVCMALARPALTMRSKGQRSSSRGYQMRCCRGYAGRYDCLAC